MLHRRAFTVIEFIVASVLTLSLVATVSVASSTLQRGLADNRFKTQVALYAMNALEIARAMNCGAAVDPDSASTATIIKGCNDRLVVPGGEDCAVNNRTEGDGTWRFCIRSGDAGSEPVKLDITMSTNWRSTAESSTSNPLSCTTSTQEPPILHRTLKLEWVDARSGTRDSKVFTDLHAYPTNQDLYNGRGAGLVVLLPSTASVSPVTLTTQTDPSKKVVRLPEPCTDGNGTSLVARFPYLPSGGYRVTFNNTSRDESLAPAELRTVRWSA
jgi:type II secretory pathway pseudopilin PulG